MEKRQKKEEKQEELQSRYFMYAILFVVILIAVILSFRHMPTGMFSKEEKQSYSYNGFVFTNITGLWFTEIQKAGTNKVFRVPLHYGPRELQNVTINGDVVPFQNLSELYITFDPVGEDFSYIALAASELSINLAQTLGITPIAACTKNETQICYDRPIIDCESSGLPAICLRHAEPAMVYVENNCIFVQGQERNLMKAADRLLLKWFSVMQ